MKKFEELSGEEFQGLSERFLNALAQAAPPFVVTPEPNYKEKYETLVEKYVQLVDKYSALTDKYCELKFNPVIQAPVFPKDTSAW